MGQAPSEVDGETCVVCQSGLSGVPDFDHVNKVSNWYWGNSYEYNFGEYYRRVGFDGDYRCSTCWWGDVTAEEERRQQEEKRRREEALRRLEEEQRLREEERRRQKEEERRKHEEEERRHCEEIDKLSRDIERKLQSGNSLSEKQLNWLKKEEEQLTLKQREKIQTFPSDSDYTALENIKDCAQNVEPVTFSEQELKDPHFKQSNFQMSLQNMFMQKPYLGKALSLNTHMDIQSWLLRMLMENKSADMLERTIIEDMMWKIQSSLTSNESFQFTQALIEITLQHGVLVLDSKLTTEKGKILQAISDFLKTNQDDLKKENFKMSILVDVATSGAALSSEQPWIRAIVSQLFQQAVLIKGKDWGYFLEACQDIAMYSCWKPSTATGFVFHLASHVANDSDMNKCITLLHRIVSYSVPDTSLDITGESIATADNKVMAFITDQADKDVTELLKELVNNDTLDENMLNIIQQTTTTVLSGIKNNTTSCGLDQLKLKVRACFVANEGDLHRDLPEIILELCTNVKKLFGWWPRGTQILSIALLLVADKKQQPQLLEMATGEGKSCVIAMFVTCLALQNEYVDIITSSPVLAKRDTNEWSEYYSLFGLSVACNGGLSTVEKRLDCYKQNIVYGTVGDFAADVLRQEFEMDDVRGRRSFDNVVVDEVDQMTLDQGIQFTYLSHRMVGIRQLEPVLAIIWATVSQHVPVKNEEDELLFVGHSVYLFDAILQSIDPESCGVSNYSQLVALAERENLVTPAFSENAQSEDEEKKKEGWKEFDNGKMIQYIEALNAELPVTLIPFVTTDNGCVRQAAAEQFIDQDQDLVFILVLEDGRARPLFEMDEIAIGAMAKIKENIVFGSDTTQSNELRLPKFLEVYVNQRLPVFVRSAFTAMTMSENREYIVKDGSVLPVDFSSTGVIEKNKKWGDGLQQFIEMKHFCKVSSLSLVTNFMSNVTFFKRYNRLFGASGTLGSEVEAAFLKGEYNANVCRIPTHKKRKLYCEELTVAEGTTDDWMSSIIKRLTQVVKHKPWGDPGRAALVICEDIDKAQQLHAEVSSKVSAFAKIYTEDNEEGRAMLSNKLQPGEVLIATNLAGRGTNVKVTDEVNLSGGLYVIVTFIPRSKRTQLQAFGRTARKGAPGSAKMIVHEQSVLPCYHNEPYGKLLTIRDDLERERIYLVWKNDLKDVELRQKLFAQYCSFLQCMYAKVHGSKKEEITLDALNEQWGIWLQMQNERIENLEEGELVKDLAALLTEAEIKLSNDESPSQNIYHVVRFANEEIIRGGDNQRAINLLNIAIDMDKEMASIAYYNRAKCILMQSGDNYLERAKDDLATAATLLVNDIRSAVTVLNILSHIKPDNAGQHFADQCQKRQEIVNAWRENMEKAIKKLDELINNNHDATISETAIYHILPEPGKEESMLLLELADMGLERVFTVKKKVEFSFAALIVFLIGIVQIVAGAVLVATGVAASFGMGLIAEGVSDVIEGIKGMITGDFDLKQWAIGKSVSMAISIVSGGVGKALAMAKKVGVAGMKAAVKSAFKIGLKGMKSAMKSGLKKGVTLTTKAGKGTFARSFGNISNQTWRKAVKENLKKASKHVVKEMAQQGAETLFSESIDNIFESIMEEIRKKLIADLTRKFTASLTDGKLRPEYDSILLNYIPKEHLTQKVLMSTVTKEMGRITRGNCQLSVRTLVATDEEAAEIGKFTKQFLTELVDKSEMKKKSASIITGLVEGGYYAAIIAKITVDIVKLSTQFEEVFCAKLDDFLDDEKIQPQLISDPPQTVAEFRAVVGEVIAEEYITAICNVAKHGLTKTLVERTKSGMRKLTESVLAKRVLTINESEDVLREIGFEMSTQLTVEPDKQDTAAKTVTQYVQNIKHGKDPKETISLVDIQIASNKLNISIFIAKVDSKGDTKTVTSIHPESACKQSTGQITLFYKQDSKLYVKRKTGDKRLVAVGSRDVFTAISKAQKPDASQKETATATHKLKEAVVAEVLGNKERWAVPIARQLRLDIFYAKRREILYAGSSYREGQVKIMSYMQQNMVNRISKGFVLELSLGKSKLTPQSDRPAGLDLTCRRYPSQKIVKSLSAEDSSSSRVMTYLKQVSDSKSIINFVSLSKHFEDSLHSRTEHHSTVTQKIIFARLKEDNVSSALMFSFVADFPDTIRQRTSNGNLDRDRGKEQVVNKVMVLDSDTVGYYREGFLGVAAHYHRENILDDRDWMQLKQWIMTDQYARVSDETYKTLCEQLKK